MESKQMKNTIRAVAILTLTPVALLAADPALCDTLYSSADFVPGGETGDYFIDNGGQHLFAASFTLSQASNITGVGGVFTKFDGDGGSIFAEIIAAPAQQTLVNTSTLEGLSLAHTVFTAPTDGSDATTALSVTLGPGTYELVFGSGLFGATGSSGLATGMNGLATLAQSIDGGLSWDALNDSVRVTVSGNVVPLPATLPLLCSGLLAGAGFLRRRRSALHGSALAGRDLSL
jgi:hypothetical protein